MRLYFCIILLCIQIPYCSSKQNNTRIDVIELINKHQQINNINYDNIDSVFFNLEIRQIEKDTIISIEGGKIEHYSYIGPILPPPPLPVFEGEEPLNEDSIYSACFVMIKQMKYWGTYHHDKYIVSIFYEKGFKRSWLSHLFKGIPLENRKKRILNYTLDSSVTFDYITTNFSL